MCNANYATEYSSWSDTLIFGKGKKSVDHPEHGMEQTPLPEWLRRYSFEPMRRGLSNSFFCFPITLFPFRALLPIMAQRRSAAHTPQIATQTSKECSKTKIRYPPPPIHTPIPPHHLHLTFCVASNSYDNIFASRALSLPYTLFLPLHPKV